MDEGQDRMDFSRMCSAAVCEGRGGSSVGPLQNPVEMVVAGNGVAVKVQRRCWVLSILEVEPLRPVSGLDVGGRKREDSEGV